MGATDSALLLIRVTLGVIMIAHGLNHWIGGGKIEGTAGWFSSLGLRNGRIQAWASVITEIGAGLLLVLGFLTPLACAATIAVMAVAGVLAHRKNGFFIFRDGYEYVALIAVVALALALTGPGRFAVDAVLPTEWSGWAAGVVALAAAFIGVSLLLAVFWRPGHNDR